MGHAAQVRSGRIFINYRRDDAAYPAGWLFDRLDDEFRDGEIFKDVDSIEPGDDFLHRISAAVGACDVFLALIGPRWLDASQDGQRRLDNPNDLVRFEIEVALARNIRVVPVLVDGARMPRADELPPSLAPLVRRHAVELGSARFARDVEHLLTVLRRVLALAQGDPARPSPVPPRPAPVARLEAPDERRAGHPSGRQYLVLAAAVVSVAVAGVGRVVLAGGSDGGPQQPPTTPVTAPPPSISAPPSSVAAPPTSIGTSPQSFVVFRLCELPCAIELFAAPDDKAAKVGSAAVGQDVRVVCQAEGLRTDGQGGRASEIWDRLEGGAWIPDAYVFTGVDGFVPTLPRC